MFMNSKSEFGFCEAEVDGMSGFIFQNANGNPMCEQNINDAWINMKH